MNTKSLHESEHEARCDLIDALDMLDTCVTEAKLTASEIEHFGSWVKEMWAKYPQQKAPRPEGELPINKAVVGPHLPMSLPVPEGNVQVDNRSPYVIEVIVRRAQ